MSDTDVQLDVSEQIKIRIGKLKELQDNGKDPFSIVKYEADTFSNEVISDFSALEGEAVSISGRIMTKRLMGKASFCDIQDRNGRVQTYVKESELQAGATYEEFKKFDIGDIVGVKGVVFKTQKDEISVRANEIVLLSKSLQVLPEKFHGLKDVDLRYRQRYVDLIVTDGVKETFVKRSKIIRSIRSFLDSYGFLEVETPVLQTIPGGAAAKPFVTHHNTLDIEMFLRISPELYLKRLIVGGIDKVYEIGRVFRNEGMSTRHNPEFTMLELYEAYTDYHGMMEITEHLIRSTANDVNGSPIVQYGDHTLDFSKKFERISMVDAIKKYANVDFDTVPDTTAAKKLADEHKVAYEKHHTKGEILNSFFEAFVEDKLIDPTFIIDHPIEISPLTKKKPNNPDHVERFELFVLGKEIANAYTELNDPLDQRARFEHQESLREHGDDEANQIDEDFLTALSYGMPPTGGLGIGIDRLVMFLTNAQSIKDVILFPTMKPL